MTTTFSGKSSATAISVVEEPDDTAPMPPANPPIPHFDPDAGISIENDVRRLAARMIDIDKDMAQLRREKLQTVAEAKELGIDTSALKQVVKLQTTPAAERQQAEDTLDAYKRFLGLIPDFAQTPIGAHIAKDHAREAMAKLQSDPALAATAARLVDAFGSVEAARGAIEAVTAMSDQETIAGGGATVTPIGRTGGGRN
ncbi:GapR family DNA-binding domain-containing protein [Fodinicurvata sp. EGI_FJ10296]|uniref:GapR family DNA-binding domain-containing protein n=1 Tax=Fodinicurvata sp. EGI_FJ10296 TaxID=3231908 RepID=UPI0034546C19